MKKSAFNSKDYKDKLQKEWDKVAIGWDKWWPTFEEGAKIISDKMITLSVIKEESLVLDLATGIGEPAITAAKKVGSKGKVIATDMSQEMLNIAKRRAAELNLDNIDFRNTDIDDIKSIEYNFDAIYCRWGLFFLPDLKKSLNIIKGKLKTDGYFVATVFDIPSKVPALSLPMKVVTDILNRQPPSGPSVFSLSNREQLISDFKESTFREITIDEITIHIKFKDAESYTQYIKDVAVAIRRMMSDQTNEKQNEIWNAITSAVQKFALPDGSISIPMTSIIITAQA